MTPALEPVVSALERQSSLCSRIAATQTCPLCRGPIEGRLASIDASIVCVGCELLDFKNEASSDGCSHTVSEWEALNQSGCLPSDLGRLRYLQKKTGREVRRRYLRGEVWFLRNLRRKEKMEPVLGIKLREIHPVVRPFVLGDFLKQQTECTTSLEDVMAYTAVHSRATKIVKRCEFAHPQAALEFCVQYPDAGLKEFQEMKEKVQKVFHLEGRRILHGLTIEERELLKDGPLGDVYEAFHADDAEDIIRGYLKQWFHKISIDAIMDDDGWKNFEWASGSEDRVAPKLKTFWEEKLRRKEMLTNALKAKKLPMPESCINCEAYLNGNDELSLKEIVAGVDLSKNLRKLEFDEDQDEWAAAFYTMFHCLNTLKKDHFISIRMAIERAHEVYQARLHHQVAEENEDEDDNVVEVDDEEGIDIL